MLFSGAPYAVFILVAYLLFWLMRGRHGLRTTLLVAGSYVFYVFATFEDAAEHPPPVSPAFWSVICLAIIFLGSTIDFAIGLALGRTEDPKRRKTLLLISVCFYLSILALFRYWNFASDNVVWVLRKLGAHVSPVHVKLVLPFGISFFTFETMSYTIDVYRKEIEPAKSYGEYLLFVAFFPHLVSGPIVRPQTMLPQLAREPVFDSEKQMKGLFRIGVGLVKKLVLADMLGANLVAHAFEQPEQHSSVEMLTAVYGYAFLLYNDFSGYTDIALGSASLFGYELPENFNAPYLSQNLQEFWRRWHISLSSWLRDYLYIPLGGSKGTSLATYRNLFLTMLIGGLWHGANWTFVIWGALHGGALAVVRVLQRRQVSASPQTTFRRWAAIFFTFHYVCFAWIFFKSKDLGHAWQVLRQIARGKMGTDNLPTKVLVVLCVAAVVHAIPTDLYERARKTFAKAEWAIQGVVMAAVALVLHELAGAKVAPFTYGQF